MTERAHSSDVELPGTTQNYFQEVRAIEIPKDVHEGIREIYVEVDLLSQFSPSFVTRYQMTFLYALEFDRVFTHSPRRGIYEVNDTLWGFKSVERTHAFHRYNVSAIPRGVRYAGGSNVHNIYLPPVGDESWAYAFRLPTAWGSGTAIVDAVRFRRGNYETYIVVAGYVGTFDRDYQAYLLLRLARIVDHRIQRQVG